MSAGFWAVKTMLWGWRMIKAVTPKAAHANIDVITSTLKGTWLLAPDERAKLGA